MNRNWVRFGCAVWAAAVLCVTALAQSTGTIYGTVFDASGAIVPAATVTAINISTNQQRTVLADELGKYVITVLPVGNYNVRIEKGGFAPFVQQEITLQVNTNVQVNGTLQVKTSAEQVTVSAQSSLVQASSSTLVQVVDERRVVDLPLNGRNVLQLMSLNAGVSTEGAGGGSSQIQNLGTAIPVTINGSRGNGTNFLLDNGDNNDGYVNIALPFPSPDAVQEFSIQTSTFDAQYGRGIGGVVNVVTRSGANDPHGSLFEYVRHYQLNAANFFSGRDSIKRNQLGGSFGGPVWIPKLYNGRDRTFFFFAYQGTRLRTATPGILRTSPSEAMKAGDFSEWMLPNGTGRILDPLATNTVFPNNVIPQSRMDIVARKMFQLMPASTPGSGYQIRIPTPTQISNDDQFTGRLDQKLTASQRLSGRVFQYLKEDPWVYAPEHLYYVSAGQKGHSRNVTLNHSWILSAKWLNDFNFTNNVTESNSFPPLELAQRSLEGFGARVKVLPGLPTMAININGWSGLSLGQGYTQTQKNYQFTNVTNYATGRHNLKFGAEWRRYSLDKTAPFNSGGNMTFNGLLFSQRGSSNAGNSFAEFFMGQASEWRQQSSWSELLTNNYIALFAQEDFRATSRLTFNLGLRWDPRFDFKENLGKKQMTFIPGQKSQRFPNAPLGLVYLGDPTISEAVIQPNWSNLAPRIGVGYQITPKTVVRAAYGIFYDQFVGILNNRVGAGEPFVRLVVKTGPASLSDPYAGGAVLDPLPLNPDSSFVFTPYSTWALASRSLPAPYMQNWNLIVERQVLGDVLVRVGYVGSHGTRLLQSVEVNPAIYGPGANASNLDRRRPYQPIGALQLASTDAWSKYHSMQLTLQKRWSHGFSVLANHTWSKSIDRTSANNANSATTGPDPYNWNRNVGVSDFDLRHRLVISGIWEAPALRKQPALVRYALGGWQNNFILNAGTGLPLTINSGVDNAFSGVGGQFADLTGVDWRLEGGRSKEAQILRWFNPAAFTRNAVGTVGTGGRNQLREPGRWNLDYSLFKGFRVSEKTKLQVRGEFFNVFNHANLGAPVAGANNPNFARINTAGSPRIIQLALRLAF